MAQDVTIYDFEPNQNLNDWDIVNDGVMGGLSQSSIHLNDDGNAVFTGKISLENNGGFASVRHQTTIKHVQDYTHVNLRVKGKPSTYQFRIKKSGEEEVASYVQEFEVTSEWKTIQLKLSAFSPRYRGRTLNLPDFEADVIREVAFLIGNKKAEEFQLEIDKVYLTK
ncbi:CIA30 family protein [Psychroflexus sp. YR1-1]|uniref:CIA30 family protein n=1 Tax=Psychroflexus aurantiacus TaxID=2709310 RepID=A0A6B3R651_9FLAO|nr:CIA30 family protein [Psychroflexus aurantiacus]NEV92914.1 CIA30 family protein [Psychroflexus aurantiacus]